MGLKILHTADWHLGKRLFNRSRLEEQREVLQEIIDIADAESVDVVLIAGDVYDVFSPSAEAHQLFYQTIMRLANHGQRLVIAIAGNHDAADRIAAPDELAKANSILLVGHPNTHIDLYTFNDRFAIVNSAPGYVGIKVDKQHTIHLLLTPFTNELRLKHYLGEDEDSGLNEYLRAHWHDIAQQYMQEDDDSINLLMTHLFMWSNEATAPEEPDGEKPIRIGTSSLIKTQHIPDCIHYTALGHLHRSQQADANRPVYYSGSPLQYSFSEAGQQKFVHIVERGDQQQVVMRKVPLDSGCKLIKKKVHSYEEATAFVAANKDAHIELNISVKEYLKADEVLQLQQLTDNLLHIIPEIRYADLLDEEEVAAEFQIEEGDILQHFKAYFKDKKGIDPNQDLVDIFKMVLGSDEE